MFAEKVISIELWHDNVPRIGVANCHGRLVIFSNIFDNEFDDYSDLYEISDIDPKIIPSLEEINAIWERLISAYINDGVDYQTHPAFREDRARRDELNLFLDPILKIDRLNSWKMKAVFEYPPSSRFPTVTWHPL